MFRLKLSWRFMLISCVSLYVCYKTIFSIANRRCRSGHHHIQGILISEKFIRLHTVALIKIGYIVWNAQVRRCAQNAKGDRWVFNCERRTDREEESQHHNASLCIDSKMNNKLNSAQTGALHIHRIRHLDGEIRRQTVDGLRQRNCMNVANLFIHHSDAHLH